MLGVGDRGTGPGHPGKSSVPAGRNRELVYVSPASLLPWGNALCIRQFPLKRIKPSISLHQAEGDPQGGPHSQPPLTARVLPHYMSLLHTRHKGHLRAAGPCLTPQPSSFVHPGAPEKPLQGPVIPQTNPHPTPCPGRTSVPPCSERGGLKVTAEDSQVVGSPSSAESN